MFFHVNQRSRRNLSTGEKNYTNSSKVVNKRTRKSLIAWQQVVLDITTIQSLGAMRYPCSLVMLNLAQMELCCLYQ